MVNILLLRFKNVLTKYLFLKKVKGICEIYKKYF